MWYELTEWARRYYYLTKPGIVISNALTATAGYLFATSQVMPNWVAGVAVIIGTSLVIASACVINNIIDRDIDRKMERTKERSLVTGRIAIHNAAAFAVMLGVLGFTALTIWTNTTTVLIGAIAYVWYIVIYGYSKRRSEHGTLIGTVPGALPAVAGYVALMGRIDLAAVIIFLMMVTWQMAHFYAIAIYRRAEYKKAGVPILTVTRGNKPAIQQMIVYIIAFAIVSVNLTISGYTGIIYAVVMIGLAAWWLIRALRALPQKGKALETAARGLFGQSLVINLAMCFMIAIGGYLL